jgi:NTE family protein
VEAFALGAKSWQRHTFQLAGFYGYTVDGVTPAYDPFLLGGFLRGSGYLMDELLGKSVALLRAVYINRLATLPAPLGSGIYAGGSLEATRASLGVSDGSQKTRPSASIFIGADTFLGPVYLALGHALSDDRQTSFYLILGAP